MALDVDLLAEPTQPLGAPVAGGRARGLHRPRPLGQPAARRVGAADVVQADDEHQPARVVEVVALKRADAVLPADVPRGRVNLSKSGPGGFLDRLIYER